MHADAVTSVLDVVVDAKLLEAISKTTRLRSSASMSVRVHMLPDKPAMVDDDGEFRYVVLGPAAASDSGKPVRTRGGSWTKRPLRIAREPTGTPSCWQCRRGMASRRLGRP
ncbi:MAG: hypothetical protein LC118_18245 [Dehalococcoidia bacterium]|nr:hypothetical protein [Dehalococcoidia bacterium]